MILAIHGLLTAIVLAASVVLYFREQLTERPAMLIGSAFVCGALGGQKFIQLIGNASGDDMTMALQAVVSGGMSVACVFYLLAARRAIWTRSYRKNRS